MKQLFLFMIALICLFPSYSQSEYNSTFDSDYTTMLFYPKYNNTSKKVNKIVFQEVSQDGTIEGKYIKCFDNYGNLTYYARINRKNDTVSEGKFTYQGKNLITLSQIYKKGKLKSTAISTYDKYYHMTSYVKRGKKNKIRVLATWTFNDNGKIKESLLFKKDSLKIRNRWVYEYNEDGTASKSILYSKNGSVKKVWSYQCNPEGEKVNVKEKEVQICKNSHSDDQFYIITNRSINEKGKVYKTVQKLTNTDHLPIESCTYNENDSLVSKSVYDKSYERPISFTGYNKKGKKTYEFVYTYENGNRTSYTFSRGGKVRYKTIFKYNSEGFLVEEQHYNSKDELISTTKLIYE